MTTTIVRRLRRLTRRRVQHFTATLELHDEHGEYHQAACTCGWRGPEHAAVEDAGRDRLNHEIQTRMPQGAAA